MPRCELHDLQAAYRRHFRLTHRTSREQLTWPVPGRVWAADHAQPPSPVDGRDPALLSVRDLASGLELAWLPVPDETAATTAQVLATLFARHGPPLVLKSDNGSAFKSRTLQALLEAHRIVALRSPPRTPRYNGSSEAGIGSLKKRTRHFAARQRRLGTWTRQDLEAARRQGNELTRPQGHRGPTPAERWADRSPIRDQERDQLASAILRHRTQIMN